MFKEIKACKRSIYNRKLVEGVGINDASYNVKLMCSDGKYSKCHYYSIWSGIIERCYSNKFHIKQPTYKECFVCEGWLTFTNFKRWMVMQNWEGNAIDKDIIKQGNKEYCPKYCSFVPRQINSLVVSKSKKGSLPVGVYYDKRRDSYISQLNKSGKHIYLGQFRSPKEARLVYVKAKLKHIKEVAISYFKSDLISKPVLNGLMNWEVN